MSNMGLVGTASKLAFLAVLVLPAQSQECPPGSTLDHVERSATEESTYCKCQAGYVAQGSQCVLKLPSVDPAFFTTTEHPALIKAQLAQLASRKRRLEKELQKLTQLRDGEDGYLQEMGEMREQLMYDSIDDLLSLVGSNEFLGRVPGLSSHDADQVDLSTKLMKGALDTLSYTRAGPDRERERETALGATKECLAVIAKISAPSPQKEALSKMVEISFEVIKGGANQWNNNLSLRDRATKALDAIAAIAGAYNEPLGIARSAVNLTGSGIVLWSIETDKDSIVESLISTQRARLALDQRLASTEELINFYEVELRKSGKQGG